MSEKSAVKLAIFASGAGSNAERIIKHFRKHKAADVALVVTDQPEAGVLEIAKSYEVPSIILDKKKFFEGDAYLPELQNSEIGFIVLAGFMRLIPQSLIEAYPKRIVNIHPALLPKFGGKGMYGQNVHEAVIAAREPESGISIHYVDTTYDTGEIIYQTKLNVEDDDTAETLAEKIKQLEHREYPQLIEAIISRLD